MERTSQAADRQLERTRKGTFEHPHLLAGDILAKGGEPTTAECTGVSTEMSIAVTSHKPGDVLEQGVECVFIAECGVGKDRACDEVQILLGVNGWTGKSWRTVHDCARVDPSTGRVSVRWRVQGPRGI